MEELEQAVDKRDLRNEWIERLSELMKTAAGGEAPTTWALIHAPAIASASAGAVNETQREGRGIDDHTAQYRAFDATSELSQII